MTVRKLTAAQKTAVVTIYTSNIRPSSIKHLAEVLCVSTRTIGRVIDEAKIASTSEASKVMQMLYRHKITIDQLESLLNMVMVKPSIQAALAAVVPITQTQRSRKSPASHNGKQTLLPLNFPTSLELH